VRGFFFPSPFSHGRSGVGLLVLRVVAAVAATGLVAARLTAPSASPLEIASGAVSIASALSVVAGLFTTASASILAITVAWFWFPLNAEVLRLGVPAALMTIADAIVISLLGPGAFSIDARLFGPREIVVPRDERGRNAS
jgi:uncharacterized membrane protein YphA (DoxX/SURF4 family)